jgi:ribonuclease Z
MPSERLIRAGSNATLLIHEATMADDEIELAHSKKHSTFGQAVDVGRRQVAVFPTTAIQAYGEYVTQNES